MTPEILLDSMYPGDESSGLPRYMSLNLSSAQIFDIDLLAQLKGILNVCCADLGSKDINEVLKAARKENPEVVNRFVVRSLEVYFSAPQVISVLRSGAITLFPNHRSLPDIDFDLLMPVLEMGVREKIYD